MPLTAKCIDCQQNFTFPAQEKTQQSGKCPDCEEKHKINQMNLDIDTLQAHISAIRPTLCQLNQARHEAKTAYLKAESAWENLARKHAILIKRVAFLSHERDLLNKTKEVIPSKSRTAKTLEEKALEALNKLSPEAKAAILKQLRETKNE